ncbi:hypothetical protein NECID01_0895 [Nematocida sp. AWRm77]|nr:hypothetical protein NECID01_0895 [Nematocida sp. AWRm77]
MFKNSSNTLLGLLHTYNLSAYKKKLKRVEKLYALEEPDSLDQFIEEELEHIHKLTSKTQRSDGTEKNKKEISACLYRMVYAVNAKVQEEYANVFGEIDDATRAYHFINRLEWQDKLPALSLQIARWKKEAKNNWKEIVPRVCEYIRQNLGFTYTGSKDTLLMVKKSWYTKFKEDTDGYYTLLKKEEEMRDIYQKNRVWLRTLKKILASPETQIKEKDDEKMIQNSIGCMEYYDRLYCSNLFDLETTIRNNLMENREEPLADIITSKATNISDCTEEIENLLRQIEQMPELWQKDSKTHNRFFRKMCWYKDFICHIISRIVTEVIFSGVNFVPCVLWVAAISVSQYVLMKYQFSTMAQDYAFYLVTMTFSSLVKVYYFLPFIYQPPQDISGSSTIKPDRVLRRLLWIEYISMAAIPITSIGYKYKAENWDKGAVGSDLWKEKNGDMLCVWICLCFISVIALLVQLCNIWNSRKGNTYMFRNLSIVLEDAVIPYLIGLFLLTLSYMVIYYRTNSPVEDIRKAVSVCSMGYIAL